MSIAFCIIAYIWLDLLPTFCRLMAGLDVPYTSSGCEERLTTFLLRLIKAVSAADKSPRGGRPGCRLTSLVSWRARGKQGVVTSQAPSCWHRTPLRRESSHGGLAKRQWVNSKRLAENSEILPRRKPDIATWRKCLEDVMLEWRALHAYREFNHSKKEIYSVRITSGTNTHLPYSYNAHATNTNHNGSPTRITHNAFREKHSP